MTYIILDFEYNQPFDFEKNEGGKALYKCPFEIVQIGGVKLDEQLNITDIFNEFVKPKIYKRMHPFVEKITHITNKMLKGQSSFEQVYPSLVNFIGEDSILCFWGSNDLKELFRNANYYSLDYKKLPSKYIDIQKLASTTLDYPQGKTIGLKNAALAFGLETDAEFHNALNDAFYTAKIFKLVRKEGDENEFVNVRFSNKMNKTNYKIDTFLLFKEAEKDFGRELTKKERKIIKKYYELGRLKSFDKKTSKLKNET